MAGALRVREAELGSRLLERQSTASSCQEEKLKNARPLVSRDHFLTGSLTRQTGNRCSLSLSPLSLSLSLCLSPSLPPSLSLSLSLSSISIGGGAMLLRGGDVFKLLQSHQVHPEAQTLSTALQLFLLRLSCCAPLLLAS